MAGWHHWLDGHEFEWTLGVGDGQGGLACCYSWGRKESDMTEWLNWTELKILRFLFFGFFLSQFFYFTFFYSFHDSNFSPLVLQDIKTMYFTTDMIPTGQWSYTKKKKNSFWLLSVHSEGDQPWDFFERNDAKAETPVLGSPHAKSWLIGKDSEAGRDWGQEKKGMTEDEMAGWYHWLDGHESEWTPGVGEGQGGLACCDSWGRKESDKTEQLIWSDVPSGSFTPEFIVVL